MEKQPLQYSTLVYILAVLGLPLCCCAGAGVIPSAIGYFIANTELKKFYANPNKYSNQDNIYTGKIIALVVLIINLIYIALTIYNIYTVGWDNIMEESRQMMEKYQ